MTANGPKAISNITTDDLCLVASSSTNLTTEYPAKIWQSGIKEVFEIELDDGSTMQLTEDHQVATVKGWMTVREAFERKVEILCHAAP
jgi:hypothetical protein